MLDTTLFCTLCSRNNSMQGAYLYGASSPVGLDIPPTQATQGSWTRSFITVCIWDFCSASSSYSQGV